MYWLFWLLVLVWVFCFVFGEVVDLLFFGDVDVCLEVFECLGF